MQKVKIETITPVHVGSGNVLRFGSDFVQDRLGIAGGGRPVVGIIDPAKIFSIIGEKNVDKWVSAIERGESTKVFLSHFGKACMVDSYSRRLLEIRSGSVLPTDTLREQLHDAFGRPYLPGSSIKGAIRTAVLSETFEMRNGYMDPNSYNDMEKALFGRNPYEDVFRFMRVGDAYFDNFGENTVLLRMQSINITKRKLWDTTKTQLVEAIAEDSASEFSFDLVSDRINKSGNILPCLDSVQSLFKAINMHTSTLLKSEQDVWQDFASERMEGAEMVNDYLDYVQVLLDKVASCTDGHSCILRIGYASGWRFITGAWTELYDDDAFEKIIMKSRPHNKDRYSEYIFPKTRRVKDDGNLLGFVKLTIAQ